MRINGVLYTIKQGLKNIYKNKMFSLASIGTMASCIFLFGVFFAVVMNFKSVMSEIESGVAITVFFNSDLSEEEIHQIGTKIEERSEVSDMHYVSAEAAWDQFKKDYFGNKPELADAFADDNPLADSANYQVYLKDVSQQANLVKYVESIDGVREVKASDAVANTLTSFNVLIGYVSVAIIIILMGVSVFLISNTVTIGIAVRKEEIAIMKLIGATDFFVKAPFIVEGMVIGLIGSGLPLLVLHYFYNSVVVYVNEKFMGISNWLHFISVGEVFRSLIPISLCLGVGIGFLGSFVTIRKHLRV